MLVMDPLSRVAGPSRAVQALLGKHPGTVVFQDHRGLSSATVSTGVTPRCLAPWGQLLSFANFLVMGYTSGAPARVEQEIGVGDIKPIEWANEYFGGSELELVARAYEQAVAAHDGQTRVSGEPYVVHCVEVARMLAELELDHQAVAAGLLHDIVEDTDWTVEDISRRFGQEVAQLVDGQDIAKRVA